MVDGCRRKLVNVVSGVPQYSVLETLLFLLYASTFFFLKCVFSIGYGDDSTLLAIVSSPGVKIAVAESMNRGLGMVREWFDFWGLKLNGIKTKVACNASPGRVQCFPCHPH